MKHALKILLLPLIMGSCSDTTVVVDIDIPVNQANPFIELSKNNDGYLVFQFDALVPNYANVNDLDSSVATIQIPSSAPFLQANKESYDLSELSLDSSHAYRVTLFGTLDTNLPAVNSKYKGVASCPLTPGLGGSNTVAICLGLNGTFPPAVCADTLPFDDCPK